MSGKVPGWRDRVLQQVETDYECLFRFEIAGVRLDSPLEVHVPASPHGVPRRTAAHAEFTQDGPTNVLVRVRVRERRADVAALISKGIVDETFEQFLLRFPVTSATPPRLFGMSPLSSQEGAADAPPVADPTDASVTRTLTAKELGAFGNRMAMRFAAPGPAHSADLYTAINMLCLAIREGTPAIQFLMLYNALSLACKFRGGSSMQDAVDELIKAEDPNVQPFPKPKRVPQARRKTSGTCLPSGAGGHVAV